MQQIVTQCTPVWNGQWSMQNRSENHQLSFTLIAGELWSTTVKMCCSVRTREIFGKKQLLAPEDFYRTAYSHLKAVALYSVGEQLSQMSSIMKIRQSHAK